MLTDILRSAPARSIDDVVSIMTAIDDTLPDDDGVKWFNRLYLKVTLGVRAAVADTTFADHAFMSTLDVVFANLYFSALAAAARGDSARVPASWRPLIESRADRRLIRLQFALAGMNAHINRDLPVGIVTCFDALGGDPEHAEARRRDFDAINALLERVEGDIKPEFSIGLVGRIDVIAGQADDLAAMWKVRAARAAAWTNAEVLWTLKPARPLYARFLDRLDGLTALAGRGLLAPVCLRPELSREV
jgi:hypothetical protein